MTVENANQISAHRVREAWCFGGEAGKRWSKWRNHTVGSQQSSYVSTQRRTNYRAQRLNWRMALAR
jgi:hypothetical protein